MYSMVTTSVLHGMEAILVQVEADVSPGLPTFEMVGFLSSEVKEMCIRDSDKGVYKFHEKRYNNTDKKQRWTKR